MISPRSLAAVVLVQLCAALAAQAQEVEHFVVVQAFVGPKAERFRQAAIDEIAKHADASFEMVTWSQAEQVAKKESYDLTTPKGLMLASQAIGVTAWLQGGVRRKGKRWLLDFQVCNGADGAVLARWTVRSSSSGRLLRRARQDLWAKFEKALPDEQGAKSSGVAAVAVGEGSAAVPVAGSAKATVPSKTASQNLKTPPLAAQTAQPMVEPAPAVPAPDDPMPPRRDAFSSLELALRGGLLMRRLVYNANFAAQYENYTLQAPTMEVEARIYPFAFSHRNYLRHIGIDLRGDAGLGIESQDSSGNKLPTKVLGGSAGLRFRIPIATHEIVPLAAYDVHWFDIGRAAGATSSPYPSVAYHSVRLGFDSRFHVVAGLHLGAGAAYLYTFESSQITDAAWIGGASAGAFEARALVAYRFALRLELQAVFDIRQMSISQGGQPANPFVGDAAVDRTMRALLGLAWSLPVKP